MIAEDLLAGLTKGMVRKGGAKAETKKYGKAGVPSNPRPRFLNITAASEFSASLSNGGSSGGGGVPGGGTNNSLQKWVLNGHRTLRATDRTLRATATKAWSEKWVTSLHA